MEAEKTIAQEQNRRNTTGEYISAVTAAGDRHSLMHNACISYASHESSNLHAFSALVY